MSYNPYMPLIFQYGSNCDERRLNGPTRLNGDAQDLGRAETIDEYDVAFNVWSRNNGCAAADLIPTPNRYAWGVLYRVSDKGIEKLQRIEGAHYAPKLICVRGEVGGEVEATTFLVESDDRREGLWTSAEYVGYIVNGLRAHNVPEKYVQHVIEVAVETNRRAGPSAAEATRLIRTL
jgi:AIG2 family protein